MKIIARIIAFLLSFIPLHNQHIQSVSVNGQAFETLINQSHHFQTRVPLPTQYNRIAAVAGYNKSRSGVIEQHARTARPIVHVRVMSLIKDFLEYKKQYGSIIERLLYADMNELSFVDRLLTKRPLMFMTESDKYLLRNGKKGYGGFEHIGTQQEHYPLVLSEYLSYDEMQISALIGVSGATYFINNGSRANSALPDYSGNHQEWGIYEGFVGARFEKPGLMEWQHMIITPEQNTKSNGYGLQNNKNISLLMLWSKFYDETFATFEQAAADTHGRYIRLSPASYLDTTMYKKRMKMVIEPFLVDANDRGAHHNKKAYCHVVGLGLGVWQKSPIQAKLMLDVYAEVLATHDLPYISDINFSWFPQEFQKCGGIGNAGILNAGNNTIKIHFSQRNPADALRDADADKLLVALYAWDGNAYPGNEYWAGYLTASGDPAAACCSTIAELHNPLINDAVSAKNIFIIK